MKMKTILIGSIIVLFVFLIYLTTLDKKVYYLSLGDGLSLGITPYGNQDYGYSDYVKDYLKDRKVLEKYVTEFSNKDYRTTDFIKDIETNIKLDIDGKKQTIKNALIKADLITLSVGFNDLQYKMNISSINSNDLLSHVDGVMDDIEKLFEYIKEYCKEDVLVVGYYVPVIYKNDDNIKEYIKYANDKLLYLTKKYKMTFIDISEIGQNTDLFSNPASPYISKEGYEIISEKVIEFINEKIL